MACGQRQLRLLAIKHKLEKEPKRSGTYLPFLFKEEDTTARKGR